MPYRMPPHVLAARIEAEDVLVNTGTGRYHAISGVGPDLLADLVSGATLEDASRGVSERTGQDYAVVLEDTRRFVAELVERGLVEVVPQ